ncbi:MAG: helix-hairpin-helix domain-containing protein [Candidatus Poribacteria bacterium]|nr:helix-hairpin-helix domain-containing protein [Candidatus Poribacteria bacterium]
MKKDATTEDRRDKSGMALHLVKEAIDALQARSPNSTSTAVRKLQTAAFLVDNKDLVAWCDFQLGKLNLYLATIDQDEDPKVYFSRIRSQLKERKIPFTVEELIPRLDKAGGGFSSIEFIEDILNQMQKEKRGNDGTHYRSHLREVISATANAAATHANRLYANLAFGEVPRQHFDLIRDRVDNLLLDICPDAIEQFMTAYERLAGGRAEDWSLALTSCRRIIKAVADVIYPPQNEKVAGREVGDQQYINRIWAFLDENMASSSDKNLAKAHIDYLGSFIEELNKKTSKGVHSAISHEEAVRTVLYTYLTLGDILDFTSESVSKALEERGKLNINSASIEEMLSVPGMTNDIAKQIVKRRVKQAFASIEELQELKGVGPSTVQKLGVAMIALPTT